MECGLCQVLSFSPPGHGLQKMVSGTKVVIDDLSLCLTC